MNTVPILTYHSIDDSGSPISVAPSVFRAQMAALHDAGWRTLTPRELVAGHAAGAWPDRSVVITFDDGFANFATAALPVLVDHRFTATLFVVAGHVGGTNDWKGQPAWAPRLPLLDWTALRDLPRDVVTLGAHSWSHRRLASVPAGELPREIVDCKREIEDRTGATADWYAYPYGETTSAAETLVARHFAAGVGTRLGFATPRNNVANMDRIDVCYLRRPGWFGRMDADWLRGYLAIRRLGRKINAR